MGKLSAMVAMQTEIQLETNIYSVIIIKSIYKLEFYIMFTIHPSGKLQTWPQLTLDYAHVNLHAISFRNMGRMPYFEKK